MSDIRELGKSGCPGAGRWSPAALGRQGRLRLEYVCIGPKRVLRAPA